MLYKDIEKEFSEFKLKYGDKSFKKFSDFVKLLKDKFEAEKREEFIKIAPTAPIGERVKQSWNSFIDSSLDKIIPMMMQDFCDRNNLKITTDKILKAERLGGELDLVKRALLVHFEGYSILPDADLIIYSNIENNVKIHCIISIENSQNERYTRSYYWKLKLLQSKITSNIKLFMITNYDYNRISTIQNSKLKKEKTITEYELDGIYLIGESSNVIGKIKNANELEDDIEKLL